MTRPLLLLLYQKTIIRFFACWFVRFFFPLIQLFAKGGTRSQRAPMSACLQSLCWVALPGCCCFTGTLAAPSFCCGSKRRKCQAQMTATSWLLDAQTGPFPPPACSWASFSGSARLSPLSLFPSWPPSSSLGDYFCSVSTSICLASRDQTKHAGLLSSWREGDHGP